MTQKTATGSEVLNRRNFRDFVGFKIGFVGNHTSRLADGTPTRIALSRAPGVTLTRLFSPEHGAFGREDREGIGNDVDPATRLTIHSLYGDTRKPTPEMLDGLDALVFEIQDVGARFYTYSSTLLLCLEAASEAGIRMIVLDRPNPIVGTRVEGPLPDPDKLSFVVSHAVPVRHGLTLGELARIAGAERKIDADLTVIPSEGWRRSMWWDETGLEWVSPSPAMRSLETAAVYPGVCLLEQTNVSVGRGTEAPFLIAGAPWIDGDAWAKAIEQAGISGVMVLPHQFMPSLSKFEGEACGGIRLKIVNRDKLNTVYLGLVMITALRDLYPAEFEIAEVMTLLANHEAQERLEAGDTAEEIEHGWEGSMTEWRERAKGYLLYT